MLGICLLKDLLSRLWSRWKVIAHAVGNFQSRVLLTIFYFLVIPPFALVVKLLKDPLQLHSVGHSSYWLERQDQPEPSVSVTRQF